MTARRPVARISTSRTLDMLYGPDGVALAEFCDDHGGARRRTSGVEQRWREWELELVEGAEVATCSTGWPTGCSTPARSRQATVRSWRACWTARIPRRQDAGRAAADPVHRAVAEQVEQLLEWDRAVRADVYDSVHQMRVTTRKIRSLLQASEGAFGISDDAWVLDELRELAGRAGRGARRRGAGRALREGAGRTARRSWCADRSANGWSTAPSGSTSQVCGGR